MRDKETEVKYKNQNIRVSAIIPVRINEEPLQDCLKSLQEQTIKPYEIIVVPDEQKGQSYARIKGALQAKGNVLLFVDSDIIAQKNALEQVLKKKEEGYAEVVARMIPTPLNKFSEKIAQVACPDVCVADGHVTSCGLHFTVIDKELFLHFSKELQKYPGYAGDIVLSKLLRENNFRLGYTKKPSVYHIIKTTPVKFFKKRIMCGYALGAIFYSEKRYWNELFHLFVATLLAVRKPPLLLYRLGTLVGILMFIKNMPKFNCKK
uniref:Glycosyltransferase family 2 protein n=1 Tax=Fervidobacterium pennivorans TaxID=93466 RepID=A0A7V4KEG9_FERPE